MARKGRPSSSKWTSTESRVVPGRSETIIRSAWARVLMNVDLPVLGRPTTAIFMTASAGFSSSAAGKHLLDHLEQSLAIPVLLAGDRNRLAAAKLVEFSAPLIDLGVIGLVHDQDDRRLQVPQPLGHFLVERHQLVADVHHEENQAGLVHCRIDLPVHVLAQIVAVDHADSAGVDQLEETWVLVVAELGECPHPVAGNARLSSTIAILRPANQFRSEDLPTLGRPTITTLGKAMPLTSLEESSGGAPGDNGGKRMDDQALETSSKTRRRYPSRG